MDGKLVAWEKATTHVLSHTLHYGTGAFEGIRSYPNADGVAVFRLRDHMARLLKSCKILMIDVPYTLNELCEAVVETIKVNGLETGCYIRPLVFLGYGEMGINPLSSPVNVAIATWPWGPYFGEQEVEHGVRTKISSWTRHSPNAMPSASKTIGGLRRSHHAGC
jgi:branched-chain amino acid aminotransferase